MTGSKGLGIGYTFHERWKVVVFFWSFSELSCPKKFYTLKFRRRIVFFLFFWGYIMLTKNNREWGGILPILMGHPLTIQSDKIKLQSFFCATHF